MHPRLVALGLIFAVMVPGGITSCSFPAKKLKGDRAFISYHPPPEGSQALRVAVKDNINLRGTVTTAGSEYLAKTGKEAREDAECLKPVRAAGVWFVGKTNLNEFALGASGVNDYFGTPKNPYNRWRTLMPGGSSSGSAVAVASGKADIAIGTDTAGSIRTPAACCGVLGLKTTKGRVSLEGVHPISRKHLDTVGPMATSVPDLVRGLDLLVPGEAERYAREQAAHPTAKGLRVGRLYIDGTDRDIDAAVDAALKRAGFTVVDVTPVLKEAWEQAQDHGNRIAVVDGYESDKEFLDKPGVSARAKAALLLGDLVAEQESYRQAVRWKRVWQGKLKKIFRQVDYLAVPTLKEHPVLIPLIGRVAVFEAYVLQIQNTVPVNYAGNPAVAVPIPVESKRIPVTSLQLIGPEDGEASLLNAARIVTSNAG